MRITTKDILWICGILLVICAWICGLFIDLTGDSGLYAAISRQMVESGDWINLQINGRPYLQKPHLLFWLAGAGISILGNTNLAFKLFPFLFGISSLFFTYRYAKYLFSENAGRIAALVAGTSQMFFLYFLDIHTDTVLQTGVILALWQLSLHLGNGKLVNLILGFIGVGLAMLSKGPIGAALPFFTVFLYLLLIKEYKQLFHPKWLIGVLIIGIIILPALWHLWNNFGSEGFRFYFINNNIGRITGEVAGSNNDPLYYIYNMLWAFLPWTVPVIAAAFLTIRSWSFKDCQIGMKSCLMGSVLIILAVFSIAKGKAPNYLMMLIPPVSVIVSGKISELFFSPDMKKSRIFYALEISLLVILIIILVTIFILSHKFLLAIIPGGISLLIVYYYLRNRNYGNGTIVLVSLILTGMLNLIFNLQIIPDLYTYQGSRQALSIFEANRSETDRLCNFELEEYELFFYSNESVVSIDNWEEFYQEMDKPGTWIYTNKTKYNDIVNMNYAIDSVYVISQRGMNRISLEFLNPLTRDRSLKCNYLIKTR